MTPEIVVIHRSNTAAAVIAVILLAACADSGANPGLGAARSQHPPAPPPPAASRLSTEDSSGGVRAGLLRRITAASIRVGTARLRRDGRPAILAATPANPVTRTKRQPDDGSGAEPLALARMFDERSAEADMLP